MASSVDAALADAGRRGRARVLASALRVTKDFDAAEDAVQDAFAAAARVWNEQGVPDDATAWLTTVARRKALDRLRREQALVRKLPLLIVPEADVSDPADTFPDERLRLIFTCCHPALDPPARVALTLRLVGGLTTAEIARLFLVPTPTMAARLTRAKKKIRAAGIAYRIPAEHEWPDRLPAVLAVVSLLFTEAMAASSGDELRRHDLMERCGDLAGTLAELMPDEAEVLGLLATVRLAEGRAAGRIGAGGVLVPLENQDRARWDQQAVAEGRELAARAMRRSSPDRPGPYALHAAVAAVHSEAHSYETTDWAQVVALYDLLLTVQPSPVTALARASARSMVDGPAAALAEVDELNADRRLADYAGLPATRADLLRRLGRYDDAAAAYERAAAMTGNAVERNFLLDRARQCRSSGDAGTAS